jgi:hypothetical protein
LPNPSSEYRETGDQLRFVGLSELENDMDCNGSVYQKLDAYLSLNIPRASLNPDRGYALFEQGLGLIPEPSQPYDRLQNDGQTVSAVSKTFWDRNSVSAGTSRYRFR